MATLGSTGNIVKELYEFFEKHNIRAEEIHVTKGKLVGFHIYYGDQKYDHQRCEYLIKKEYDNIANYATQADIHQNELKGTGIYSAGHLVLLK